MTGGANGAEEYLASVEARLAAGKLDELEIELDQADCADSFYAFVQKAWHILEPSRRLTDGKVLRAICGALQAVTEGKIRRLLINVPPGCTKSVLVNVLWTAWEWGPRGTPSLRYISASYNKDLATRDMVRCRTLMLDPWFQARWPIELKADENNKTKYDNTKTGWRMSASVGSALTGFRGDRIIIDDPHSALGAESAAERAEAILWWRETLPTRLNDADLSAIVVIMQRLHVGDISGHILANQMKEYRHLCLPMRYEPERHSSIPEIGFTDWRTMPGELLWAERFSEKAVDEQETVLGPYAFAGQMQQRPVPRDGGMFPRKFARVWEGPPPKGRRVRAWDLAASKEKRSAWTVGLKMCLTNAGELVIENVVRVREEAPGVEAIIRATARLDGTSVDISIPQDPGQAGKAQKLAFAKLLNGFPVYFSPESGEKADRAIPLSAQWAAGNVAVVQSSWTEALLDELADFPGSAYLDQGDAASRAHAHLLQHRDHDDIGGGAAKVDTGREDDEVLGWGAGMGDGASELPLG